MASLKDIRGRIKSVKNTQQVTKAMKMVAAAKLRRAQDLIMQLRPYATKLNEIKGNLIANLEGEIANEYAVTREEKKILFVVISSDRGLCGGFNSNLLKAMFAYIEEHHAEQLKAGDLEFLCVGKKGFEYLRNRNYSILGGNREVFSGLSFAKADPVAEEVMKGFLDGTWDKIYLAYNEFVNVMVQKRIIEPFLPIPLEEGSGEGSANSDYIFEPDKMEIVTELIPKALKLQFYRGLLESNASEQGARMIAMDNATENAEELLKDLKRRYNKARQAAITKEILEIVSGAEALSQGG